MSALEIIAAIILVIIGLCAVIWGNAVLLTEYFSYAPAHKKPAAPAEEAEKNNHSKCDDFAAEG